MSFLSFSFTQALVIGGLVLTLVFYLLFLLCYRKFTFAFSKHLLLFSCFSWLGYVVFLMSFILVTVYSLYLGHRPWLYFLILALSVLYVAFGNNQKGSRIKNISIIAVVSLLLPLTILSNNNFLDFGTDQGAHLRRGLEIVETGGWEQRAGISYYEPFPVLSVLLASITIVTGFSSSAYVFLLPFSSLLLAFILYSLSKQITSSEKAGALAFFVILSIPPLAFILLIPRDMSLIFAFICLHLVIKLIYKGSRATVLCLIPPLVIMVILHATGPFLILSLFLPLGIYSIISRSSLTIPRQFRSVSILMVVVMFTYWVFNHMVIVSVMGVAGNFFITIAKYLSGMPLSYEEAARPYFQASTEMAQVWFAWAIPPAIVAGYCLHRFHDIVVSRAHRECGHWAHKMAELGSATGLLLLLISFILAYYGHYIYTIVPVYALLAFLMIYFLSRLLATRNELVTIITVVFLIVFLFIGSSSPTWAPIENPDFPTRRRLYNQIVYTQGFGQDFPQNVSLVLDFDAYPDIPEGINIQELGAYRVVREMLLQFERGVSINEITSDDSYILILRFERLVLHQGDTFNLVRSSGKYVMITPVHYLFDETSP